MSATAEGTKWFHWGSSRPTLPWNIWSVSELFEYKSLKLR